MQVSRHYPILEVVVGLLVPLGILVALDHAWLRQGQSPVLEGVSKLIWVAAAVCAPIVFWRLLRHRLPGANTPLRWAAIVLLTAVCSLAWFYVAFTVFVNIHLLMGGSL